MKQTWIAVLLVLTTSAAAEPQWVLWARMANPSIDPEMSDWHKTSGRLASSGSKADRDRARAQRQVFIDMNPLPSRKECLEEARVDVALMVQFRLAGDSTAVTVKPTPTGFVLRTAGGRLPQVYEVGCWPVGVTPKK